MATADLLALDKLVLAEKQQRVDRQLQAERQWSKVVAAQRGALKGEEHVVMSVLPTNACCGRGTRIQGLLAPRATKVGVIVCHPFPPLGGCMHDINVVTAVRAFEHVTTLRFDFRTGLDGGASSRDDLRAACDFLLNAVEAPPERLILVGYSYGSLIVADVAPTVDECSAFVLLAPPLGVKLPLVGPRAPEVAAARSSKPKLALLGDADQFCGQARFDKWASTLRAPADHHILLGREIEVGCCGEHSRKRRLPVHHLNICDYVEEPLTAWVCATFGVKDLAQLAESDGRAVGKP